MSSLGAAGRCAVAGQALVAGVVVGIAGRRSMIVLIVCGGRGRERGREDEGCNVTVCCTQHTAAI